VISWRPEYEEPRIRPGAGGGWGGGRGNDTRDLRASTTSNALFSVVCRSPTVLPPRFPLGARPGRRRSRNKYVSTSTYITYLSKTHLTHPVEVALRCSPSASFTRYYSTSHFDHPHFHTPPPPPTPPPPTVIILSPPLPPPPPRPNPPPPPQRVWNSFSLLGRQLGGENKILQSSCSVSIFASQLASVFPSVSKPIHWSSPIIPATPVFRSLTLGVSFKVSREKRNLIYRASAACRSEATLSEVLSLSLFAS